MLTFKLFSILLAMEVFGLTYYLSVIRTGYRNFESLTDYIPVLIAAAFGALTYFLCDLVMEHKHANEEKIARAILQPVLPAGETLLASTFGFTGPSHAARYVVGIWDDLSLNRRRRWYYVGISQRSLAIVKVKGGMPTGKYVLRRSQVMQVKLDKIAISGPRLLMQFAADPMILWIDGDYTMTRRAEELMRVWRGQAISPKPSL